MQYYDQRCLQEKIIRKEIVNHNNILTFIQVWIFFHTVQIKLFAYEFCI